MGQFTFNKEAAMEFIRAKYALRLQAGGEIVAERMRELTDTDCPEYNTGKGGHSAPGSPPYRETGDLHDNIQVVGSGLAIRVGTPSWHGVITEMGIGMNPRPWALRSLTETAGQVLATVLSDDTRPA